MHNDEREGRRPVAHPLQNHPGLRDRRELPLRPSLANLKLDTRTQGALPTACASFVLLGVLVLFFLAQMDLGPHAALQDHGWDASRLLEVTDPELALFWALAVLAGLSMIALGISMAVRAIRQPLREQKRYYALRGLTEPSPRQRRALRPAGHWMHHRGAWPLTIECFPTSQGMTARQVRSFRTFLPEPAERDRDDLAADWGILNAQDAREAIETYLHTGIHSLDFALTLREGGIDAAERMAALSDLPVSRVLEISASLHGRPAQLLWGWDLIRTGIIVRFSVIAGYLTTDEGLERLEEITDYIAALFPTEHELIENCELGFAFWAGAAKRAELRERASDAEDYLSSEWPGTLGPWPAPSGRPLPPAMADGFAQILGRHEDGEGITG